MIPFILAIDPGTTESGVVLIRSLDCHPLLHCKVENESVFDLIDSAEENNPRHVAYVIEYIASYGMPVGAEVFEAAYAIGDFRTYITRKKHRECARIYRREEKLNICHSPNANDATIRLALVDRFAYGVSNHGKGTKANPGFFYGFRADEWAAFAVAVTYRDKMMEENHEFINQ